MSGFDQSGTHDRREIDAQYFAALSEFSDSGQEAQLSRAYDIARDALNAGISLAEISGMHHMALNALIDVEAPSAERVERVARIEQFFLEVIAVYDMALRGYQSSIHALQEENRRRVLSEKRLLLLTKELQHQRDSLDEQVQERTAELAQKALNLLETNMHLQQTNTELAEFTYAISHDLKSPLNTIGMLVGELLNDYRSELGQDGFELIDMTLHSLDRMQQLIKDVVKYSRTLEAGVALQPVDLEALIKDIATDFQSDHNAHSITVDSITVDSANLPTIMGNEVQLRMLFQNLLSNAVKFHDPAQPPKIEVFWTRDAQADAIRISVSDNGIGIDPKFHDRIFSLFQRLHTYETYPGSGLGLALCQRVALNHKGYIDLTSSPGQGATFSLVLKGDGHGK